MRPIRRVATIGIAISALSISTPAIPAMAGAGGTTGDGDQRVIEKTIKEKSERPGKTTTKEPPSKEELEALKKRREAELKRLKKLFDDCMAAADTKAERAICLDEYAAAETIARLDPRDIARKVVARLQLPASTPILGPAPELNVYSPGDLVVNYPYWLSVPGDPSLSTTATSDGLTLTLKATRTRVVFDMGNGDTVTCTTTLPWPGKDHELDKHGRPVESPVCGYRFPDRGTHTITATVTWDVTWSGGGLSGVIQVNHTDSIELDVIELHAVIR